MSRKGFHVLVFAGCAALMLLAAGCSTYDERIAEVRGHYIAGNYEQAAALTSQEVEDCGASGRDRLIWLLEDAAVKRAAGKFDESTAGFETAYAWYTEFLDAAKISLSREGLSLLTTPVTLPYHGTGYDGVMICTYLALNDLQRDALDSARVNLNRAYGVQQDVVRLNSERIEKEQAAIRGNSAAHGSVGADAAMTVAELDLQTVQPLMAAYAPYVNPFAVWLDGVFRMTQAADEADLESARKSLERATALEPMNETARADYRLAKSAKGGTVRIPPTVYVILETGLAPALEQCRVRIPLVGLPVSYVGISYPRLRVIPEHLPYLRIAGGTNDVVTQRMASMDAIVGKEFQDNFPGILARAIASAVTKAVASTAANVAVHDQDAWVKILVSLITMLYQDTTNIADTRSWRTLPKEFQICSLEMPADRKLRLSFPGWERTETLIAGDVVVVYIKAITSMQTMTVHQFKLK